ncbi:MAG: hypothetical protein HQL22_00075 [Candidatus Omnitrophica bacterium]|nr:hypothetical protein [Candidatus Omnitrophota bacterium]
MRKIIFMLAVSFLLCWQTSAWSFTLGVTNASAKVGDNASVSVNFAGAATGTYTSAEVWLRYDPAVLQLTATDITQGNLPGLMFYSFIEQDTDANGMVFNRVKIGFYGLSPLSISSGTLANLNFKVLATAQTSTAVQLEPARVVFSTYTTDDSAASVSNGTFAILSSNHTITASAGAGGSISPGGAVSVTDGASQVFTVTPNQGFNVDQVVVDGASASLSNGQYSFTNVTADHAINVSFVQKTQTITVTAGAGGTIVANATIVTSKKPVSFTVNYGADLTLTVTPDSVYDLGTVLADGNPVSLTNGTYTFTNNTADHTFSATFVHSLRDSTYTLVASAGTGGSISPSGNTTVAYQAGQIYTITPNTGYNIAAVLVDGSVVTLTNNQYAFTNVTANHTISADFSMQTYSVVASAGNGGSISPVGITTLNYGGTQTYTMTANTGYSLDTVSIDGNLLSSPVSSYTFSNITSNHSINATFTQLKQTITASSGAGGMIHPSGAVSVAYGGSQTFILWPNPGYDIGQVLVDGAVASLSGQYTFTNVTVNHTFAVSFIQKTQTISATAGTGGTITPSGVTTLNYGAGQQYSISVNTGYNLSSVTVDGIAQALSSQYSFVNVTSNHAINVTFAQQTRTVSVGTVSPVNSGIIALIGSGTVAYGSNLSFTVTPNTGYDTTKVMDGSTELTLSANNQYTLTNIIADHTISAIFTLKTYAITASAGVEGTITPSGTVTVNYNGSQSFVITPKEGYSLDQLFIDNVPEAYPAGSHTFTNVKADHTISATFKLQTRSITATAGNGGTISPNGVTTLNYGTDQAYTITPNNGYSTGSVLVDGLAVTLTNGQFVFKGITANHTISADFSLQTRSITALAGNGGTITPAGTTSFGYGANQTYNITAKTGYSMVAVRVDGNIVDASDGTYVFSNIVANHTIAADFTLQTRQITAAAGVNGTITPSGTTTLNYGSNQTYAITPGTGYNTVKVLVDGNVVDAANGQYVFNNVILNHSISAEFSLQTRSIVATAGSNGTITPAGTTTLGYGASQMYQITPKEGYSIAVVRVDGNAVSTANGQYFFENVIKDHTISADFTLQMRTITASATDGGSVSPLGVTTLGYGSNQTYSVTPTEGYSLGTVLVDGAVASLTNGQYIFTDVTVNHTISASFTLQTRTITASETDGGSISPLGATTLGYGASQTYQITPNEGYSIAVVRVDGKAVSLAHGRYVFDKVIADHTIAAEFTLQTETITASATDGGTIAPAGVTTLNYGSNQTYSIAPKEGYNLGTVLVDGVVATLTNGQYIFTSVKANHSISAAFTLQTRSITATAGANGAINPSGTTTINYGANQQYTIVADDGFMVDQIMVDGAAASLPESNIYAFNNVTVNHEINVTFKRLPLAVSLVSVDSAKLGDSLNVEIALRNAIPDYYNAADVWLTYDPSVLELTSDNVTQGTAGLNIAVNVSASEKLIKLALYSSNTVKSSNTTLAVCRFTVVGTPKSGAMTQISFNTANLRTNTTVDAAAVSDRSIKIQAAIAASASVGGSISPAGAVGVSYGASQTFTMGANPGYVLDQVVVDGVAQGALSSYTFSNVAAGHVIVANYKQSTSLITASADEGGVISPSGSVSVNLNGSQTFTVSPNNGYGVYSVLVDGKQAVLTNGQYTFTNVTVSHTISVSFAMFGELNNSPGLDAGDAAIAAQISVSSYNPTAEQLKRAHVSSEPEISMSDAAWIARKAVNPDLKFPADLR